MTSPAAFSHLRETLSFVRFSHTLFALPFALTGMLLAADGLPAPSTVAWIVVAMAGARTAAMAFNRLVDRRFDAANPRTRDRSLPAGRLTPAQGWVLFGAALLALLLAAWRLNPLALALAPVAVVILCGYSLTKRFTSWSHLVLGLALAGAPLGAWIAVRGDLAVAPLALAGGVLFWTAGFDVIYALQDVPFDRRAGLHSLPVRLGPSRALAVARGFHLLAGLFFTLTGIVSHLGPAYFLGVAIAAVLLVVEHALVRPDDPRRLQIAFFRVNVAVALILLGATSADLLLT
ncbi:MAG: UbiA-like polyprenyltransferase [Acidobacteriota bacterium]